MRGGSLINQKCIGESVVLEELCHGLFERNMNPTVKTLYALSVLLLVLYPSLQHFLFDFPYLGTISAL